MVVLKITWNSNTCCRFACHVRLREGVRYVVAFSHEANETVLVAGMDGRLVVTRLALFLN
jgi:hypothetical protein